MNSTISLRAAALSAAAVLLLAGCGEETSTDAATDAKTTQGGEVAAVAAYVLEVEDPWVKAADSGMTAAFATLVNTGSEPVTVVSAASEISAVMELHETVASDGSMVMQPKEGGFTIEPGDSHELAPGGDHIMIMSLSRPVEPGEDITITLTFSDGSTQDVVASVKDFSGAEEEYLGDDMDMGDTSMDSEDS